MIVNTTNVNKEANLILSLAPTQNNFLIAISISYYILHHLIFYLDLRICFKVDPPNQV